MGFTLRTNMIVDGIGQGGFRKGRPIYLVVEGQRIRFLENGREGEFVVRFGSSKHKGIF